jgi:hypothetical protein
MTTRSRQLPYSLTGDEFKLAKPGNTTHKPGSTFLHSPTSYSIIGAQRTVSTGNPWLTRKRGFHGDIGGNFYTEKKYVEGEFPSVTLTGNEASTYIDMYNGPVVPFVSSGARWSNYSPSSDDDLDEKGATAVARCKPTNSAFDTGVFIGELIREGLPRFGPSQNWQERTAAAKAAGDDYLNVRFGWEPLVNGVQDFLGTVNSSYSALQQMRRDSGRFVRRSYSFEEESSHTSSLTSLGTIFPGGSYYVTSSAQRLITVETVRKCWFSGAFVYHLPDSLLGESKLEELRAVAELNFGIAFTPETLWNLAPWTWAVDWFTNAGDVIANISGSQRYGLIMPYGYVMENSIVKRTVSTRGVTFKGGRPGVPTPITFVTETKTRRKANPFGFGVSDADLDPSQISILAALGMSRSR